jgi:hypothetical protein
VKTSPALWLLSRRERRTHSHHAKHWRQFGETFGDTFDDVNSATGGAVSTSTTYAPAGPLERGKTHYWRFDENNNDGMLTKGRIWSFTVADSLIVNGIESYNDLPEDDPASNRIYLTWIEGFGTTTNGALVGNLDVPLTERGNIHGGSQAMPLSYNNNFMDSEATLTLTAGRHWTREGVVNLSLWFRGDTANAAERMYMALNGSGLSR